MGLYKNFLKILFINLFICFLFAEESRRSSVSSGFHSENSFGSGQSEKKGSEVSKNGKPATPEESKRSASRSHGNSSSVTTGATASKSSKNNSARSEETSAPNLLGTIGIDSSVAMSNESVGSDRSVSRHFSLSC